MRRNLLGVTACLATIAAASASAQDVGEPAAYGGFGGAYVQAPSLYYPYPGVIESRFGTFFTVPVVPGVPESHIEAATIDATNAAHAGAVDPAAALAPEAKDAPAAVGANRKPTRTYARGYSRPPAPFRRALPRGNLADLNLAPEGGIPAYTPESRYQTYGQAYGLGPYGTNYYSGYWHGYAPMNYYPAPVYPVP
ncbi:hypothetical protein [Paludisphaera soli]|uniref:hypothetical protein n=1 Tax=Paludisphaera soli TaxID=2712865 RepID=UPI0013EA9A05|nr:hypothetical protein [Paludisphaera soli]